MTLAKQSGDDAHLLHRDLGTIEPSHPENGRVPADAAIPRKLDTLTVVAVKAARLQKSLHSRARLPHAGTLTQLFRASFLLRRGSQPLGLQLRLDLLSNVCALVGGKHRCNALVLPLAHLRPRRKATRQNDHGANESSRDATCYCPVPGLLSLPVVAAAGVGSEFGTGAGDVSTLALGCSPSTSGDAGSCRSRSDADGLAVWYSPKHICARAGTTPRTKAASEPSRSAEHHGVTMHFPCCLRMPLSRQMPLHATPGAAECDRCPAQLRATLSQSLPDRWR